MPGEVLDVVAGHPTCETFDVHLDDVPTRVFISQGDTFVSVVKDGGLTVWSGVEGERCTYLTVHFGGLDKKEPLLVHIHKESTGRPEHLLFKKKNGVWTSAEGFGPALVEFREKVSAVTHFTLDVNGSPLVTADTFEAHQFKVPTRFFFPKLGHHATEVKYGDQTVWKAGDGERVFLSKIHLKDAEPVLLFVHGKKADETFSSQAFAPRNGKWERIEGKEYGATLVTLKV